MCDLHTHSATQSEIRVFKPHMYKLYTYIGTRRVRELQERIYNLLVTFSNNAAFQMRFDLVLVTHISCCSIFCVFSFDVYFPSLLSIASRAPSNNNRYGTEYTIAALWAHRRTAIRSCQSVYTAKSYRNIYKTKNNSAIITKDTGAHIIALNAMCCFLFPYSLSIDVHILTYFLFFFFFGQRTIIRVHVFHICLLQNYSPSIQSTLSQ